jgi:hypothetical protein
MRCGGVCRWVWVLSLGSSSSSRCRFECLRSACPRSELSKEESKKRERDDDEGMERYGGRSSWVDVREWVIMMGGTQAQVVARR